MADLPIPRRYPYNPRGALDDLFAPAFIKGFPESEAAVEAWNARNLKTRPTRRTPDPVPLPRPDPRDAIADALLRGGGGSPQPIRQIDPVSEQPYTDPYGAPETIPEQAREDVPPPAPPNQGGGRTTYTEETIPRGDPRPEEVPYVPGVTLPGPNQPAPVAAREDPITPNPVATTSISPQPAPHNGWEQPYDQYGNQFSGSSAPAPNAAVAQSQNPVSGLLTDPDPMTTTGQGLSWSSPDARLDGNLGQAPLASTPNSFGGSGMSSGGLSLGGAPGSGVQQGQQGLNEIGNPPGYNEMTANSEAAQAAAKAEADAKEAAAANIPFVGPHQFVGPQEPFMGPQEPNVSYAPLQQGGPQTGQIPTINAPSPPGYGPGTAKAAPEVNPLGEKPATPPGWGWLDSAKGFFGGKADPISYSEPDPEEEDPEDPEAPGALFDLSSGLVDYGNGYAMNPDLGNAVEAAALGGGYGGGGQMTDFGGGYAMDTGIGNAVEAAANEAGYGPAADAPSYGDAPAAPDAGTSGGDTGTGYGGGYGETGDPSSVGMDPTDTGAPFSGYGEDPYGDPSAVGIDPGDDW